MRKPTVRTQQSSFTLIELLVVIAIIGLLSAIVLVNLRGARQRAKIAASMQFSDSLRASLSDALVSWWSLNVGSGDKATDIWSGNTATIYGDDYWTDDAIDGNALSYSGNDYVRVSGPSLNNITEGITLELWFKTSISQGFKALLVKYEFGALDWGIFPDFNLGRINFYIRNPDGGWRRVYNPTSITLNDNNWRHVVGTYDGRYQKLYLDSNLIAPIKDWGSIEGVRPSDRRVNIVTGGGDSWNGYQGLIDEVRIYSRGLTAFEVQKRYAEGLQKLKLAEK